MVWVLWLMNEIMGKVFSHTSGQCDLPPKSCQVSHSNFENLGPLISKKAKKKDSGPPSLSPHHPSDGLSQIRTWGPSWKSASSAYKFSETCEQKRERRRPPTWQRTWAVLVWAGSGHGGLNSVNFLSVLGEEGMITFLHLLRDRLHFPDSHPVTLHNHTKNEDTLFNMKTEAQRENKEVLN